MNTKTWIIFMIAVFFIAMPALSQAVDLPETGQTTSYDANTRPRRDDGAIQAGVTWPSRFTNNSNGTMTDNLTGLIWLQNAECFGTRTWTQALSDANTLANGSCSLTDSSSAGDWRLPNVNELESLLNAGVSDSAAWLIAQSFTDVQTSPYWSSTTYVGATDIAWNIFFSNNSYVDLNNKPVNYYVWPVRGNTTGSSAELWRTGQTTCYDASGGVISCTDTGQDGDIQAGVAWPSRFTDNSNGTVTDNLTGLMWLKDANCASTVTYDPDGAGGGSVDWQSALDFVAGINDGTYNISTCASYSAAYTGWRLPNRKELHSLTDFSEYNPALPSGHPFANLQLGIYWSSTTNASNSGRAWYLRMNTGQLISSGSGTKTIYYYYIWPVRTTGAIPEITVTDDADLYGTFTDRRVPFGEAVANDTFYTVTVTNYNDGSSTDLILDDTSYVTLGSTPFWPFTIAEDCSNSTLAPSGTCTLVITYDSGASTGSWGKVVRIYSDDPNEPEVVVSMCASTSGAGWPWPTSIDSDDDLVRPMSSCGGIEGNRAPPAPVLVSPSDGETGLGTTVEFVWEKCIDPNGDPVTYDLSYCEGAPQEDCITRELASSAISPQPSAFSYAGIGYGAGILLFGIALASGVSRRKQIALLIGIIFLSGMFLVSCGSGSGGGSSNLVSYEVSGLNPGATYYWRVTAKDDKGAGSGSQTRSFTTQQ